MTSGLEVVVRPVVLPNIRPLPTPVLAPDDPTSGLATISSSSGSLIDLNQSESHSWSISKQVETKRAFDVERVYQVEDNGNINRKNFVDVERLKKIQVRDGNGVLQDTTYANPPPKDNVQVLQTDVTRFNQGGQKGVNF